MNNENVKKIMGLSSLIGNTPILAVRFRYKGEERIVYAKSENLNMTGSIKDRMAFHILSNAYRQGVLKTGDRIIEATSGNTGISFAAIGRAMGHPVTIFMPDWMSQERINLIRSFGAKIVLVSKEEGGFLGSIKMSEELAAENENSFLPRQFSNSDNIAAHYTTTGPELWWQMKMRHLAIDSFVAGVGTGGTIMGVGKYLKEQNPAITIHPLEPANSPTLTTGYKVGKHRIQGISDEFIPSIVELDKLDEIVDVDDGDAIIMAQKLANLGIAVGISSGANFLGALKKQNETGKNKVVVTVFSDDNKKYLSTDLARPEPVKDDFLSTDVELLDYRAFKRVCFTCCDPADCVEAMYECEANDKFDLPHCPRRK
ncbi:MAG: cysteine synthase family protein [Bacteroidota bacterium]